MSEPILKALMKLFALIIDIHKEKELTESEKGIVRSFLSRQLNSELTEKYMVIFDHYLDLYHKYDIQKDSIEDRKLTSLTSMRILGICEDINKELEQKQKFYVIVQLTEFISFDEEVTEKELEFLESVASAFNIPQNEFYNIRGFIIGPVTDIPEMDRVLVIDHHETCKYKNVKHIYNKNLSGEIIFLYIPSTNTYILRYLGDDDLYLNCQHILPGLTYAFEYGSSIRNPRIDTVYYGDVSGQFSEIISGSKIFVSANNLIFNFKNSDKGIQNFNFHEESGRLVGIMGGSGVGKSTLLNVLNGNLEPESGDVLINGYNVYDEKEKKALKGVIGFVPQDDLLIEDLTVFQNLYYSARLCLNNFSEEKINEIVNKVLDDLDLWQISDLKVGNPMNKVISGGQRKRLNIALELIREPSVLFVDEPTSGLSSVDSEVVMNLLKEQTNKGKLVIINIHQPSSDLYKMFDKIIILDKGGYQIFYGNPNEAVIYFKTISHHSNPDEDQCSKCGNINPDQILQIIEAKVVDEHGKLTRTRKVTPSEWFEMLRKNIGLKQKIKSVKEKIPENFYSIPGIFKQLRIFFTRDLLSKLANKQSILVILLEAPLLAVILSFFTKYISGTSENPDKYIFMNNENIPAFLFLSVVAALFLGLLISSKEIIHDRKILQRESFLNLSRFSYLNSKILVMFLLSAIQTISFVLIANYILGIKGMTLSYWLVLFSTSCCANMMGLNISSGFNSVITIYALIPILLIPPLLLGGVVVKYDKLHKSFTSYEYVPVIGDLMVTRWAYEALAVEQFKNNKYEKLFFPVSQKKSNSGFNAQLLIPDLLNKLTIIERNIHQEINHDQTIQNINILNEQIRKFKPSTSLFPYTSPDKLDINSPDASVIAETKNYLQELQSYYKTLNKEALFEEDDVKKKLIAQFGGLEAFVQFQNQYLNTSLEDLVKNKSEIDKIVEYNNKLIRKYEPIYMIPTSTNARAHFYAPVKIIGNKSIGTFVFNMIVIWMMSFILYITLYYDVIRKVLSFLAGFRFRKKIITL